MEIFIFLALAYLSTFALGRVLEKVRIPWLFASMLIGLALVLYNPFQSVTSSSEFALLAQLGLLFTLFVIGFEIDLKSLLSQNSFILRTSVFIIGAEAAIGTILMLLLFDTSLFVAMLVATSFATVGEAVLLPILDEFKLTHTKLGQSILGVGVIDDVVEIATLVGASVAIGASVGHSQLKLSTIIITCLGLVLAPIALHLLKRHFSKMHYYSFEYFFLLALSIFFGFLYLSSLIDAAALGAILAGVSLRTFAPAHLINSIESEVKTLAYGVFAPLFFISVGLEVNLKVFTGDLLPAILLITFVTGFTKVVATFISGRKHLGAKQSIIMGISLTVRLSSSIAVIAVLEQQGVISNTLYSVLIGSTIVFKFVTPTTIALLLQKWNIGTQNPNKQLRRRKSVQLANG